MSIDPHILEFYWIRIKLEAVPKEHTEIVAGKAQTYSKGARVPKGISASAY